MRSTKGLNALYLYMYTHNNNKEERSPEVERGDTGGAGRDSVFVKMM